MARDEEPKKSFVKRTGEKVYFLNKLAFIILGGCILLVLIMKK